MPLHRSLFRYALENDCFQGRVSSLPILFAAAASDLDPGRQRINSAVVRAVWDKLLPGLLEEYDAPRSLPAIAPRSLLVVNGAQDPRCPIKVMRHQKGGTICSGDAPGTLGNALSITGTP